jgi:hypothetical protein
MMLRAALFALLTSAAVASIFNPSEGVPADSKMGAALLRRATVVQPARHLDQNNNNKAQSFIYKYDIKYLGCSSLLQINQGQNGNNNNNNNNKNNNNGGLLYTQQVVRFALCPSDSCSSGCTGGGEYVVSMSAFVDAYTEAKMTEQEYACESIRENCYCDDVDDDEVCENQCYATAGLDACIDDGDDFEIQRYLECARK